MNSRMTDEQVEAFQKFSRLKVGALFMQMGTGKTRVALELASYNEVGLLVYVAPKSALANIESEFVKWGYSGRHLLIGYETISESGDSFAEVMETLENEKSRRMVVADESVFIKNDSTIRFRRLCSMRALCDYALILNGTPIVRDEWDIYNQMEFLSPRIMDMSREQFTSTFFDHVVYKKKGHHRHDFYKLSEVNAGLLDKLIAPYVFRCDLEIDVEETRSVEWVPFESEPYVQAKKNRIRHYMESRDSEEIIALLQELLRIVADDPQKCEEVAREAQGRRTIVFCSFASEMNSIQRYLDGACLRIDGTTPFGKRKAIVSEFLSGSLPLLLSFGCGSFSLNLQGCNSITYSSLTFDYGKVTQSMFRIKRLGQSRPISYRFVLSDSGINRMVLDNLGRKEDLERLVRGKLEGGTSWLRDI